MDEPPAPRLRSPGPPVPPGRSCRAMACHGRLWRPLRRCARPDTACRVPTEETATARSLDSLRSLGMTRARREAHWWTSPLRQGFGAQGHQCHPAAVVGPWHAMAGCGGLFGAAHGRTRHAVSLRKKRPRRDPLRLRSGQALDSLRSLGMTRARGEAHWWTSPLRQGFGAQGRQWHPALVRRAGGPQAACPRPQAATPGRGAGRPRACYFAAPGPMHQRCFSDRRNRRPAETAGLAQHFSPIVLRARTLNSGPASTTVVSPFSPGK